MPKPQRGRSPQPENLPDTQQPRAERNTPAGRTPGRRATYPEAVACFERGMLALHEHRFSDAAAAFRTVLTQFPEEKELNDRARLYVALCERHLQSAPEPRTPEERLYAATLALNAGDRVTALHHLREVVTHDPNHDGALYMLGVAHALGDENDQALVYLQRAIQQNPANRSLALQDSDLERLMQDEAARSAVDAIRSRPADVRTAQRHRPIR